MVQFVDGSVKAQMGVPTMLVPIQYALTYPRRFNLDIPRMDLAALGQLTFEEPDTARFPCLSFAYEVMRKGGSTGAVVNAANEVAVKAFLENQLRFTDIPATIEHVLGHIDYVVHPSLDDIVLIDEQARREAHQFTLSHKR
jgi:1-deoxy-D-xylulose-5-phosphate reductoisomerase